MKISLQKILFPNDERLEVHFGLFYRGPKLFSDSENQGLFLPAGISVDFATYLNGLSIQKWKLYTDIKKVFLKLRLKGKCRINAVGWHLSPVVPDRHVFSSCECDFDDFNEVEVEFPVETNEQLLAFEILPYSEVTFAGGMFMGEFEESSLRNVTLCLATTTCRKEEFIKKNVRLIKDELLCESSEMREHFYVHVVDNGRTLSKEEIEGFHVTLHPNKNTGGSGGFTRGMIESMHQSPEATHVLLMDDDVLILPESIRRTYTLLTVLKDEWKEAFISGAMLEFGAMNMFHEDIGTVNSRSDCVSSRTCIDEVNLCNVIRTDLPLGKFNNSYSAWWFCCIPVTQIKKNGLPLPVFIRIDDVEYSVRCKPEFITMNGIAIWHMGFAGKYNVSMDFYQCMRNMLIAKAVTGVLKNADTIKRLKRTFYKQLLEYYYDGAEICCLILEDFMKGPSFIERDIGEKLLKEHSVYNEKMNPVSDFNIELWMDHIYDNPPLSRLKWILYLLTVNFQCFWPKFMLNKRFPAIIGFDWSHQPGIQFRHKEILAVNPFERTANLRIQNKKRCHKLLRRFFKDYISYKLHHKRIERAYALKRELLTSEEFWIKYLELDFSKQGHAE